MPKTLHLHIGWPKCASTSLQKMLHANHALLAGHGFHYPLVSQKPMGNAVPLVKGFLHERFGHSVFEHYNPGLMPTTDRADYVRRTFLQTDLDHVVLSSEGLFRTALEHDFGFLFDAFDAVRVIWVIRPKLAWLQSHYFQGVSTGRYKREFGQELADAPMQTRIDRMLAFMPTYEGWCGLVGAENLTVALLAPDQPAIELRFLASLLGHVPGGVVIPQRQNSSLGIVAAAACAAVPPGGDKVAGAEALRMVIRTARQLGLTTPAPVMSADHIASLTARFDADDRVFAAKADIPLAALQPDMSQLAARATTLAAARRTPDYARLRAALADRNIAI